MAVTNSVHCYAYSGAATVISKVFRSVGISFTDLFLWMGKVIMTPPDPANFNTFTFNLDTDPAKTVEFGRIFNATSTDLSAFKARGGKLIIYHGNSDPVFSSKDTLVFTTRSWLPPTAAMLLPLRACSWCRA